MRARPIAIAIIVFAGLDLMFLALAPVLGWVDIPGTGSPWTVVALSLAFFLALLAVIGAVSVLVTEPPSLHHGLDAFFLECGECGRAPDLRFDFCHHCGARV